MGPYQLVMEILRVERNAEDCLCFMWEEEVFNNLLFPDLPRRIDQSTNSCLGWEEDVVNNIHPLIN